MSSPIPLSSPVPGAEPPATARGRSEQVIRARILEAIFERRLTPGEKLTEDRLAELFGVSRTVVRQALARLAQDGIVELHPNRGAFVAAPSRTDARHVMEARAVVEPEVAQAAACGCDAHGLERLRRHIAREDEVRAADDRASLVRLTGEFHVMLAEVAGNPVFVRLLTELQALSSLSILLYAQGGRTACPRGDHGAIVAAIGRGEPEAAARLMREHIAHVAADLELSEPAGPAEGLAQALGFTPRARPAR
ncbi:GntR family transcriptional regulator [Starkeya koreensis]|uniref:GntR family transcriptional regulator n=1 Tax=Ancylobacter koreensis TaxID=266121 RepID=A0ABT0DH26_9HYPH|nr:GntR family transcriptional regulator [Ancylobacter koreensis]MCK0206578.1 GntR family transcriptional regulator [Ancylobacter koreensis]